MSLVRVQVWGQKRLRKRSRNAYGKGVIPCFFRGGTTEVSLSRFFVDSCMNQHTKQRVKEPSSKRNGKITSASWELLINGHLHDEF